MTSWRSLLPGAERTSAPQPEVLDLANPSLDLTAEIGAAHHRTSIDTNFAELDRIVGPEPAGKAGKRFEWLAQHALAQNHALRIAANSVLVLQLMQTYRHTLAHPHLRIRKETDLAPHGSYFPYDSPKQTAFTERSRDFDGTTKGSGQRARVSEEKFRTLAANLHIIHLPDYMLRDDTAYRTAEGTVPLWVFGRRPVFRRFDRKPVAFDYLAAALDIHLPHSIKTYGNWPDALGSDSHYDESDGRFIDVANVDYYERTSDSETGPSATVLRLKHHWNSFGLIAFRGPDELPTVGLTPDSLTKLHYPGDDTYLAQPYNLARLCESHHVTHVQMAGRVILTDQAMIEYEVPRRLQNLAMALDIEPHLQDLITTWRRRRTEIDRFTSEDERSHWATMPPGWGPARVPTVYDYTLDPNHIREKYDS